MKFLSIAILIMLSTFSPAYSNTASYEVSTDYVIDNYDLLPSQIWLLKPSDTDEPEIKNCNFLHEEAKKHNGFYAYREDFTFLNQKVGIYFDSTSPSVVTFFQECILQDGSRGVLKKTIVESFINLLEDSIEFYSSKKRRVGNQEYWAFIQRMSFIKSDLINASEFITGSYYRLNQNCSQGQGGIACVEYKYNEKMKFVRFHK